MNETKNKDDNRATESEIREVLAVEMAALLYTDGLRQPSRDELEALWRSDQTFGETGKLLRDHWRERAQALQLALDEHGLRLRPSNSLKVRARVTTIQTHPARKAFELPAVTADFDQSSDDEEEETRPPGGLGSSGR